MKNFLLSLVMVISFMGCGSYAVREQFDRNLEAYNEAVRWLEWGNASLYTEDSIREEFKARAVAAKDVKIADYRIVSRIYDPEKREATVEVDIDYYKVFSPAVRTLHDTQKWAYFDEKGTKGWRLISLPPEFR